MGQCVQGAPVTSIDHNLYDLRYFYADDKGIGHSTCGIAFESMMAILRTQDVAPFMENSWYKAVSKSGNPVVRGFLAEQICLSTIATAGLMVVDRKLSRMTIASFEDEPDFSEFLSATNHKTRLYIPIRYNFQAVDGVILLLDRANKQATIFPIQFTLAKRHRQTEKDFYEMYWTTWIKPLVSAGFNIQSTFVWIDNNQPSDHTVPQLVKALRSGLKIIHPQFSVVHVSVEMVDPKLASHLAEFPEPM